MNLECDDDWSIWKTNCYKFESFPLSFEEATYACLRQGGVLYYPDNDIEYWNFVGKNWPQKIWFGTFSENYTFGSPEFKLDMLPGWGFEQPDFDAGEAIAISTDEMLTIHDEHMSLPFVCKRRACREDYKSCDLGSQCIHSSKFCDEVPDCRDGSDENNCTDLGTWYIKTEKMDGEFNTGIIPAGTSSKRWTIEVPLGRRIKLNFRAFTLEENVAYIVVRSGSPDIAYSYVVKTLTGTVKNQDIFSINNYMIVSLTAQDLPNSNNAIRLTWTTDILDIPQEPTKLIASGSERSLLIPFSGFENPPLWLVLNWIISSEEGSLMTYYLDIDPDYGFEADDVEYAIIVNDEPVKMHNYYTSSSNVIYVQSMFVPKYGTVTVRYVTGCNINIDKQFGYVNSPRPLIPNSLLCSWQFNYGAIYERSMSIHFTDLNLYTDPRTTADVQSEDKFEITPLDDPSNPIVDVSLYETADDVIGIQSGHFKVTFTSDEALMSGPFSFTFATDCEPLSLTEFTEISTEASYFMEEVKLSCPMGYQFNMEKYMNNTSVFVTCGAKGWYVEEDGSTCIPYCQIKYCGIPVKIENGVVTETNGVIYGSTATYTCNPGFNPSISSPAFCGDDGQWHNVTECTSFDCDALDANNIVDNGSFDTLDGQITEDGAAFDTVIKFYCDDGYELVDGPVISKCDQNGWTHGNQPPSCKRVICPLYSVEHSDMPEPSVDEPVYFGDELTVECDEGFQFKDFDTATMTIVCMGNRQFNYTLQCEDIDECDLGYCDIDSTICEDYDGGVTCKCRTGFDRFDDQTCAARNHCPEAGCSQDCDAMNELYECKCDEPGYVLYEGNGFQGFSLPEGESGGLKGDVYYIGHTCVPLQCDPLDDVPNGRYLVKKLTNYHVGDAVTLRCDDNYQVDGLQNVVTEITIECNSTGQWDKIYSCVARSCVLPDSNTLEFGSEYNLQCTKAYGKEVEYSSQCILQDNSMELYGENIEKCPDIDCGDPMDSPVWPSGGIYKDGSGPTSTIFNSAGSTFEFTCDSGYTVSGSSGFSNYTVECTANGYWNVETLACIGVKCPDPGTPGDAILVADKFEVGGVLYYECNRGGFEINSPINYTCEMVDGSNDPVWSNNLGPNSLPICIDVTPPVITSTDCNTTKMVEMLEQVQFEVPVATDNFAVKSFVKSSFLDTGDIINSDESLTFTATDFEGNSAICTMEFVIIDRSQKPAFDCPDGGSTSVIFDGVTVPTYSDIQVNQGTITSATVSSRSSNWFLNGTTDNSFLNMESIGSSFLVALVAENDDGTKAYCSYVRNYIAGACFEQELFDDVNANRVCSTTDNGMICESTCNDGFVYSNGNRNKTFSCSGSGNWDISEDPNDRFCLETKYPNYAVNMEVQYSFGRSVTQCLTNFILQITDEINNNYFNNKISNLCNGSEWTVLATGFESGPAVTKFTARYSLTIAESDTSPTVCMNEIQKLNNAIFNVTDNELDCSGIYSLLPSAVTLEGTVVTCSDNGYSEITRMSDNVPVCVPWGPGQYFNGSEVLDCPEGLYQNEIGQMECKECAADFYPQPDKSACLETCLPGSRSDSGFMPCTACPVDTYWVNKTTCEPCAGGSSTVGQQASEICYDQCPPDYYSSTGYSSCKSCPFSFKQPEAGQTSCNRYEVNVTLEVCDATDCGDNGECIVAYGRAICDCNACDCDDSYYGTNCENRHHICDGNPCNNNGTCEPGNTPDTYTCKCSTKYDECSMVNQNNTTSVLITNSKTISEGEVADLEQCEKLCIEEDGCVEAYFYETAANFAYCYLYNTTITESEKTAPGDLSQSVFMTKDCIFGFAGDDCETDIKNECDNAGCHEDSVCVDRVGGFDCVCPSSGGYTGTLCTTSSDPCSPNPCAHGQCTSYGAVSYTCECSEGYIGFNCDEDEDYCALHSNLCVYGGNCTDNVPGANTPFSCDCPTGFEGTHCEIPPDFCSDVDFLGNNVGYNSINDMDCIGVCEEPYFKTIGNRCERDSFPCDVNSCVNGSCVDSDDGLSYTCNCEDGYTGSLCQHNIDECSSNPCQNGGICLDEIAGYSCNCLIGYNGTNCENDIDFCNDDGCSANSDCIELNHGYMCECDPGYMGEFCEIDINECASFPCEHNGTCSEEVNDYTCICPMGWTGKNCDTAINRCDDINCQNGGKCYNFPHKAFCRCDGGALGDSCELAAEICDVMRDIEPCANGGRCFDTDRYAECQCPPSHNTEQCYFDDPLLKKDGGINLYNQTDINEVASLEMCRERCLADPRCDNVAYIEISATIKFCSFYNMTSLDIADNENSVLYSRICPIDYIGSSCELVKDWCADNPCKNDGECVCKDPTGYKCLCKPGYHGVNCQYKENPCLTAPCKGVLNANCISTATDYVCQCDGGRTWTGTYCKDTDPDYILLVNSYHEQDVPVTKSSYAIKSNNTLSIMMKFRIHSCNSDNTLRSLLTISISEAITPVLEESALIVITDDHIVIFVPGQAPAELLFNDDFGSQISDGQWHTLGVSLNTEMSVTLDAVTFPDKIPTPLHLDADTQYNAMNYLGYGCIAEFRDVTVWDTLLTSLDFVLEHSNEFTTDESPVQGWQNYWLSPFTTVLDETLPNLVSGEINAPSLDCSDVQDIFYVSTDRTTALEDVSTFAEQFAALKNMNMDLSYEHSLPDVMTNDYYPVVMSAMDKTTKEYSECRSFLYVRYNDVCNREVDSSIDWEQCSNELGICNAMCNDPDKFIPAQLPHYIQCGFLGVWDVREPYSNLPIPQCVTPVDVKYLMTAVLQFEVEIDCALVFTEVNYENLINTIHTDMMSLNDKWSNICDSDGDVCVNLDLAGSGCSTSNEKIFDMVLSFTYTSSRISANNGGNMSIVDAFNIIILVENEINIVNFGQAELLRDSVDLSFEVVCPYSYGHFIKDDVCLPCSPGWYKDDDMKTCQPCDYGFYESLEGMSFCSSCPEGKTTYEMGAMNIDSCKVKCAKGYKYESDADECVPCPRHYYQDEAGKHYCLPCAIGYKTALNGSTSEDDCKADCDAGYELNPDTDKCESCLRGFWRDLNYDDCQPCPDNTTTFEDKVSVNVAACSMDICELGQYFNVSNEQCEDCAIGFYQDALYETECKKCDGNKTTYNTGVSDEMDCIFYCSDGYEKREDDDTCIPCERGKYKMNDGMMKFEPCESCSAGFTTNSEASVSEQSCNIPICTQGEVITNTDCTPCPEGQYSDVELPYSSTTCQNCSDGYWTRDDGSNSTQCERYCNPGSYLVDDQCEPCPRGTYKDYMFDDCTECGNSLTTEEDGADDISLCSIPICSAGSVIVGGQCSKCPQDSYSEVDMPDSSVECVPCYECEQCQEYGTLDVGADNVSLCLPVCDAGYYFDVDTNECEFCPIGFFKTSDDRFATSCVSCEDSRPGFVTFDVGSTSADECTLRDCSVGQKIVNDECEDCPVGTYQNESKQTFCYECGPNLSTDGMGKSSSDDCQTDCGKGLHGTIDCVLCDEGYFKNTTGYADCEKCPEDTTSNAERTDCDIAFCHYGKEYNEATDNCVPCEEGFFKVSLGNDERCTACELGTTTDGPGQTNCTEPFCIPGEYLDNDVCKPCAIGSYKGSHGNDLCTPCLSGYTTAEESSLSDNDCNIVVCPAGQYRNPDEISFCYDCDFNFYQPDDGQLECIACVDDKITMGKKETSEDACVAKCSAGVRFNNGTRECEFCPAGTYKENDGNFEDCNECPPDKTTVGTGKTSPSDCSRDLCQPGTFFVVSGSSASCDLCGRGTYSDSLNVPKCTNCPPGNTTRYMGSDSPDLCIDDCGLGHGYSTVDGLCYACPTGLFNDEKGMNPTKCKKCPQGTTNTKAGSDDCNFVDDKPRVPNAVDASVEMVFDIQIDSCGVEEYININVAAIDGLIRNLFIGFISSRFNGELKLCTDPECLNLNSNLVTCESNREITLEVVFGQISDFVTDTSDDDLDIPTLEVIAEILTLYGDALNDQEKAILFKGFKSAKFIDICSPGEQRVNDECVNCEAGYYGVDGITCVPCAMNTYQGEEGQQICDACPDNYYTESTNSTSLDDCIEICSAGYTFLPDVKECQACDVGSYKVSSGNADICVPCPAGRTTVTTGSTSQDDCSQNECLAGEYYEKDANNIVQCYPCPVGKYSNAVMAESCTVCAQGTTLQIGSTLITQCVDDCPLGNGFVQASRACEPCNLNYYNDKTGRNPNLCRHCAPDEFTQVSGQARCDPNPEGVMRPIKFIKIKIVVKYDVAIDSCSDTVTLNRLKTSVSFKIRTDLWQESKRFNDGRSFCSNECANINVNFVINTNIVKKCKAKSSSRRKRALTHELAFDVEINNTTETVVDVNEELPTEEVISQIFANNDLTVNDNLVYTGSDPPQTTPVCEAGEQVAANGNECEPCPVGYYSNSDTSCERCPTDTYQNATGQTSCVDCPSMTMNGDTGSTSAGACRGYCALNPNYCNNRGTCYETARRSASCTCNDGFEGTQCESRSDPTSNLGVILGAAIGGGGGLLIIIILIIGCWRHMSSQDDKNPKLPMYDPEYYGNGTYDNAGFYPMRTAMPAQQAIGYPTLGYHPDTSFEAGSHMDPYRYERPSAHHDDNDDQPQYVWKA
ncbi:hypothetical protein ACF0H5_000289 [Mactra antiquata]